MAITEERRVYLRFYYERNKVKAQAVGRQNYAKNRHNILANKKSYHSVNKDKIKARRREHYCSNKDRILKDKKFYHIKNRDYILARQKRRRTLNPEKMKEERRAAYWKNIVKIKAFKKRYSKEKLANDPLCRLRLNLRNRLRGALRNGQKTGSAVADLGCTVEFLKQYLEERFQPGMAWTNYGHGARKWNIDHIYPLSSFNLTQRNCLLKACHYTNLQPLWHEDNMIKGKRLVKGL